jgi:hypothetical protein
MIEIESFKKRDIYSDPTQNSLAYLESAASILYASTLYIHK